MQVVARAPAQSPDQPVNVCVASFQLAVRTDRECPAVWVETPGGSTAPPSPAVTVRV